MKHLLLHLTLLLLTTSLHAQGRVPFAQFTPHYFFPEFTGWHGGLQFNAVNRQRLANFEGQPKGFVANADMYLKPIQSGVGLVYVRDAYAFYQGNDLALNVAPKLRIGRSLILTPAVSVRYRQEVFNINEPNGTNSDSSTFHSVSGGAGVGAIYKAFFATVHMDVFENPPYPSPSDTSYRSFLSAIVGRNFSMGEHMTLTPTIVYHHNHGAHILELTANAQYRSFYAGVKYRLNAAAGFAFGYEFKERLRLGYSYDTFTNRLTRGASGSHEVSVRLLLFTDRWAKRFLTNLPLM